MIERSLVYVHAKEPASRFIGCGALVEGGYIATCRHVWRMATEEVEADAELKVEIEYPHSRIKGITIRIEARLADLCEETEDAAPDLVLLLPDEIPSGVMTLQLATSERFEVGTGYAYARLARRDEKNDLLIWRDAFPDGEIAPGATADGLRQFTGKNMQGYWFTSGSSGSPVFLKGGQQLAGILSLSELGANTGESPLHEAFVVPATTIRAFVTRLAARPVAADKGLDPATLQPILDAIGAKDVPTAEIPARLKQFIDEARAHAAEPVRPSNDTPDVTAAIQSARNKLSRLDMAGALDELRAKIAEVQTSRIVPLLKERAEVERLAFDYKAAKASLAEITRLTPGDVWAWIDLGDVWRITGPLGNAVDAYRCAEAAARRSGHERDLSVSYERVGDVLVAQGNLPGALQSYRDALAIRERLAKADPGNAGWQHDLSVSYERVGDVLVAQGSLPEALQSYRDALAIAERLAKADPGNAGWQRDLVVSYVKMSESDPTKARDYLMRARDIVSGLKTAGRLAPVDAWIPDALSDRLAKLSKRGRRPRGTAT